jgi:pyruvate ferredoxin oxidoreductase gamma subunit/2-oxoisovalerate ferredoxin oxidoreductase gamma subunit
MHEIRFHGRGGQGTVVASILLAKAFFKSGYYVQTFPLFGVERRGAPVESYLRLDKEKILVRSNIYTPDHIVVQDMKLIHSVNVINGLKPGGSILINSRNLPDDIKPFSGFRLAFVDADHIATRNGLGTRTHPIINTAMVGAFARILEMPPLDMIEAAIRNDIHTKAKQNVSAAQQAYKEVNLHGMVVTN